MKLYEFPPSRSIRVRWTLQELGLPFESVTVNLMKGEHRRDAFLAVNPAGKLPALVDGELTLSESVAIVLYLAEKYREPRLLPEDLAGRAEAVRWMLFAATELEQPLWRIAKHSALLPAEKRIAADIPLARADFEEMAAVLDAHLRGRDFVVGDTVTVADFVTAYTLDWANEVKLLERFSALSAYMLRMYQRPHAPERIGAAFARVRASG